MFPDIFPLINIVHNAIAFHSPLSAAPTFFPNHCLSGVLAVTPLQGDQCPSHGAHLPPKPTRPSPSTLLRAF